MDCPALFVPLVGALNAFFVKGDLGDGRQLPRSRSSGFLLPFPFPPASREPGFNPPSLEGEGAGEGYLTDSMSSNVRAYAARKP